MNTRDFYFELPEELIALYPTEDRTASRLLIYEGTTNSLSHRIFHDVLEQLHPGDVLVMNNSRVMKARLYGMKPTGGRVEILVEHVDVDGKHCTAQMRMSKPMQPNGIVELQDGYVAWMRGRINDRYRLEMNGPVYEILERIGHIPLPPYIRREDDALDAERYQTVYADPLGSIAAPTAGLHFDTVLLNALRAKGVILAYVTLHVGAGTFQPVRTESIYDHVMHSEYYSIDACTCEIVNNAKVSGRRVIAVGTTAMRSLESCAREGQLTPYAGYTNIFIYPGYTFQVCDGLITNFHLPESTLLMLVSAFIGIDACKYMYDVAIKEKYRFFSYGDGSLLLP